MFDCFISLGGACPVAASMSKYGLRSFSGVFDWLVTSDFSWVLHYIETEFRDFLLRENLEQCDKYPNHFYDKQSGIEFLHETENFEKQYEKLRDKYNRKICRFLEKTKLRVCYLRSVQSAEEAEYIRDNADYIKSVIQKNNYESEIVFLCKRELSVYNLFAFRYYVIPGVWSAKSREALRAYFDHADDFLNFCGKNYYGINFVKNIAVDAEKEEAVHKLTYRRYKTLEALLEYDFRAVTWPPKVIIYGAGIIGKELCRKIRTFTQVICFIDMQKAGNQFENIEIVSTNHINFRFMADIKVIVTATYDLENIKSILLDTFQRENIISIDDILNIQFEV
ncbi:DUF1796 family putative cysteine peptidase [uncultured Acetatifactor sp.]|jgi:hypothetical protein|uniref:DUF1796 family putative cysteine peptidase n=1 Tax=uncultured Acetatifactor sp. TaxID=1671927 RepID=UPI0026108F6D|nr:DUF1796 family putative cysteine peptidase [uncultured Acetatifactor sp.]